MSTPTVEKAFVQEMESRTASYENGTAKLFKFENMKKIAISKYKEKKALRNEI